LPGESYQRGVKLFQIEQLRWPFLDIQIASDEADFDRWSREDFGSDREDIPQGVVEIEL